jgi:hypothetical protein
MERKLGVPYGHVIVDENEYIKARELQHKGPLDISFRDDKIKALEDERDKFKSELERTLRMKYKMSLKSAEHIAEIEKLREIEKAARSLLRGPCEANRQDRLEEALKGVR